MTSNLIKLERQIHAFEGNYLGDTHHYGNISNGYEEYRWLSEDNLEVEQTRKKRKLLLLKSATSKRRRLLKHGVGKGFCCGVLKKQVNYEFALYHNAADPNVIFLGWQIFL